MSTQVTTQHMLTELKAGEKFLVRQNGTFETTTYVATGDNTFSANGADLPPSAFAGAITNGNVFLPDDYQVGQEFTDGNGYFQIIGQDADGWVMARTDGRGTARHTTLVKGAPVMLRPWTGSEDILQPAWDFIAQAWKATQVEAQLARILEQGRLPDDVEYTVTVKVNGTVEYTATDAIARRLIGGGGEVLEIQPSNVGYSKTIEVAKSSRWGCACDQVTAEDVAGLAPGSVTSWVVADCTPAVEGEVSGVHAA